MTSESSLGLAFLRKSHSASYLLTQLTKSNSTASLTRTYTHREEVKHCAMSGKRSPMSTSGAAFAFTLLAAIAAQGVEARTCGYDRFGRYRCTGLLGATIGGIIAACVGGLLLLLLFIMCLFRRRRSRRANQAYVNQPQPQMYEQQQGYYGPGPTQYGQPQQGSYYGNNQAPPQQQSYAPPNSPPPAPAYSGPKDGSYAPPPGPPPAAHTTGAGESASYYGNRQPGAVV